MHKSLCVLFLVFSCYNLVRADTLSLGSKQFSIATQNLHRFFDTHDDKTIREPVLTDHWYQHKLNKLAAQISLVLNNPDIIAVQEVENISALQDLAKKISSSSSSYSVFLEEGHDRGGIDVGFLVNDTIRVMGVQQILADIRFSYDDSYLFDRPPLHMRFTIEGVKGPPLSIVVVHNRSFYGLNKPSKHKRVKSKRDKQAQLLGKWINRWQRAHPDNQLIILGDFNALCGSRELEMIKKFSIDSQIEGLLSLCLNVVKEKRYSFIYKGKKQALDHMLISKKLGEALLSVYYTNGNSNVKNKRYWYDKSSPLRSSDHEGLVAVFKKSNCCL